METKVMKKLFTACAVAGSLVFVASAATAAPISKPVAPALNVQGLFSPVQYGGGYGGGYGYRPHCYYVRRCSGYYPYQHCWRERVCH
jgi:hypothetical protein